MKRGMTTANAIVLAVIVIGSVFVVSLFGELGGEDITGDVTMVSKIGSFCGDKQVRVWRTMKTYSYVCPKGSSCVNSRCVKVEPEEITEKQPEVFTGLQVPAGATLILGEMTDRLWTLNVGDSVVVEGKKVILYGVGTTGAISIGVNDVKEVILAGQTETVNGLTITNKEPFYTLVPPKVIEIPKEIPGPSIGLTEAQKQEVLWMLSKCERLAVSSSQIGISSIYGGNVKGTSGYEICLKEKKQCMVAARLYAGANPLEPDRYLTLRGCNEFIPNEGVGLYWVEALCCQP